MMRLGLFGVPTLLVLLSASSVGQVQTNPASQISLDQYLQSHPWDPKGGPLMVVDGANCWAVAGTSDVSGFKRQSAPCGTITALTPSSMVVLDGSMNAPLDFYDGLTRRDKVLLLMSTLTKPQWKQANGVGIGLTDLTNEQRPVFKSIVPSSLSVVYSKVTPDGLSLVPFDHKLFTQDDVYAMKLRFCRELAVQVRHGDGGGFFTEYGRSVDRHAVGDVIVEPEGITENESTSVFGISVRKTAPNFLKRADLYYDGPQFNATIALPPTTTIGDLLELVEKQVGVSLQADMRASGKTVQFFGDSARAGDVLKAVALSVAGTFRKLGDRYVLVSDLEGLGARQVKVSAYAENVERLISPKRNEWRNTTARSGNVKEVGYRPTDNLAPTPPAKNWIDSHPYGNTQDTISADKLSSGWQTLLQRQYQTSDRPPDLASLKLAERIKWNFVLPDGADLDWGGSFPTSLFNPLIQPAGPGAVQSAPAQSPLARETRIAAIVRFDDAQMGTSVISQLRGSGLSELWIQTSNPFALKAAVGICSQIGIKTRLLVRPWEFWPRSDPKTLEMNVLGENQMQAAQSQFRSDVWPQLVETYGAPSWAPWPVISPISDEIPGRWSALRNMSMTPGLEGVVVLESEPPGYEPFRYSGDNDLFGAGIASLADLGYTDQERLQFLDKYGVDPIDLVQDAESVPIDFSVPMFSGSVSSAPDLLDAWDQLRAANNLSRIENLLDGFQVPVLIEPRSYTKHLAPSSLTFVEPLIPGKGIPHSDPIYDLQTTDIGDGAPVFRLSLNPSATEIANVRKNLTAPLRRNLVTFDLSGIPLMGLRNALLPYLPPPKPVEANPIKKKG